MREQYAGPAGLTTFSHRKPLGGRSPAWPGPAWNLPSGPRGRRAAWHARLASLRAAAESRAAEQRRDHNEANHKQELAASYQALHDAYRQRETVFAQTNADRADWAPSAT